MMYLIAGYAGELGEKFSSTLICGESGIIYVTNDELHSDWPLRG